MKKILISHLKNRKYSTGFTAVELVITLFIAAAFLTTGYQLFSLITRDSGESSGKSIVSNVAYDYLQDYKSYTTNPCTASTPIDNSPITIDGISGATLSVDITCPYSTMTSISKIVVTINYSDPVETISSATFYTPILDCPTGFIPVPGSPTYGTTDFCVMKYEAKVDGSGNIVSIPTGTPMVNIPQTTTTETNVSQGKTAPNALVLDGVTTSDPYYDTGSGVKSITIDLGAIYSVSKIKIWHYFADSRTYYNTKTEVSADNITWTTVFDSAVSGTYVETASGKEIAFPTKRVRYIRDWLNGSTINTGNHWVEIQAFEKTDAINKAITPCDGCHLITDAEWLTIAQNVMSVPSNWSGGTVGSGFMYIGHNDNSPTNPLAASSYDSDGYSGTGSSSGDQRRTLTLTNGEIIWDISGNVWEFTSGQVSGLSQAGKTGQTIYEWTQWNAVTKPGNMPVNSTPAFANPAASSWTTVNGIGLLWSNPAETITKAIIRGGAWYLAGAAGVFLTDTALTPTTSNAFTGIRVAK